MSMPSATHTFEVGLGSLPSKSLEETVREHLARAAYELDLMAPPPSDPTAADDLLLSEMGDYLSRSAMLWAHLTDSLLKGPHLEQATYRAHERSRDGSGMSDLTDVIRVDVDISRLRKIRDLSVDFSRQVQSTWRPQSLQTHMMSSPPGIQTAPISLFCDAKLPSVSVSDKSMSVASGDGEARARKSRKLLPDSNAQHAADASHRSDDSDTDEELFLAIDMKALSQRGKGSYTCPRGYHCKKGGVDKEGKLVVFDRNSSFSQHCNKHCKPWRCDIPGCPNPPKKRKFARRDGLERHKMTVKHYVMT